MSGPLHTGGSEQDTIAGGAADDAVHQTFYNLQVEDDDNTFVDHGSTSMSVLPSAAAALSAGVGSGLMGSSTSCGVLPGATQHTFTGLGNTSVSKPPIPTREPGKPPLPENFTSVQLNRNAIAGMGSPDLLLRGSTVPPTSMTYGNPNATMWNPPRVVCQMSMEQSVRTMTVAPDGKSLWLAIGDDPLTVLDVDGTDLVISKSIEFVTKVYCVAVVTIPGMQHTRFKSMPNAEEIEPEVIKEDSHFLWCGLSKGHISILDLQQGSDAGYIRNAHSQTLHRIWNLPNGKVWTSGLDKAVKVWDPQTRRKLKNRNIAAILIDLCYVNVTKEVWGIAEDNVIRVYEGGGDNVRVNKQSGENTLKMKTELVLIQYCEDANLVWAGSTKGTSLIDPNTYEIACHVNITLSSLAFNKKTAIVTGHGPLLECDTDCVAVLDITNPQQPSPLFIGSQMEGVMPIGMHLFTAVPLAVVAQDEGRYQKKNLTVFTYEETMPFGKFNSLQADLPQRRVSGNFRGVPPLTSMRQNLGSFGPSDGSPQGTPQIGHNDMPNHGPAIRVDMHGGLTRSQQQAVLAASPVMLGLLEDIALSSKETRNMMAALQHGQAPVLDFAKLQSAAAMWVMSQGPGTLPTLDSEESEAIEREYATAEGKVLATVLTQLEKATSAKLGQGYFRGPLPPPGGGNSPRAAPNDLGIAEGVEQSLRSPGHLQSTGRFPSPSQSEPFSSPASDSAVLQQLASQLSRAGTAERATFQHQIQIFQRYNKRLVDRQNALVAGFSRIDQVVRTFAQHVQEDFISCASEQKDTSSMVTAKQQSQAASLNEVFASLRTISTNSSPREIHEAVNGITTLLSKTLQVRSGVTATLPPDVARKGSLGSETLSKAPGGGSTPNEQLLSPSRGSELVAHNFLPGEASRITIESLLLSPKRLLNRIEEELVRVKRFIERAKVVWNRTEDLRRVAYSPFEGFNVRDLGVDFMQFAPLLDFQEANLMLDICRLEGFLSVTESLLDRRDEAIYLALGGNVGSLDKENHTEANKLEFRQKAAAELQTLVDVTISVETFSSLVRSTIARWGEGLSGAKRRSSGGFLSLESPIPIERSKFEGSIFWAHMCMILVTQCMECVEALLFPTSDPVQIEHENFTLITKKLVEWESFVKEIERRAGHLQFIVTVCSLESDAVQLHQEQPRSAYQESKLARRARDEKQKGPVLRALQQWNFSALSGSADQSSVDGAVKALPVQDQKAELSLHHILLFLFIQDQCEQKDGVHSNNPKDICKHVLGIDSSSVSALIQKSQCLLRYNRALQKRAHELAQEAASSSEITTALLISTSASEEELLSASEKMLCKHLPEE